MSAKGGQKVGEFDGVASGEQIQRNGQQDPDSEEQVHPTHTDGASGALGTGRLECGDGSGLQGGEFCTASLSAGHSEIFFPRRSNHRNSGAPMIAVMTPT